MIQDFNFLLFSHLPEPPCLMMFPIKVHTKLCEGSMSAQNATCFLYLSLPIIESCITYTPHIAGFVIVLFLKLDPVTLST